MTVHFEQGEYEIKQSGKEVGRLVAVDATATDPAIEYFFLYQNVTSGHATYATYTAPSKNNKTVSDTSDRFHQKTSIAWEIVPKGEIDEDDFDPEDYQDDLESELGSAGKVKLISARHQDPCNDGIGGQVLWGNYHLKSGDENGDVIGGLKVLADGVTEQWFLNSRYTAPSPAGGTVTIHFESTAEDPAWIKFCVTSSEVVAT